MSSDIIDHNRYAWDWAARNGNPWTIPVDAETIDKARRGELKIVLTPTKNIPENWLGDLKGKKVLGLASGGGQQGPVLAAAGADVTIADLSPEQLKRDAECCETHGLSILTIETTVSDLSAIPTSTFDMIVNPVSNCFFPDLEPVWSECARVLKPGGVMLYAFILPVAFLFDFEKANRGEYHLKYKLPYTDATSLSDEERKRFLYPEAPLEFGHSLTDQIAGLLKNGFVIEDLYEDNWGDNKMDAYFPAFIALKARRL